MVFALTSFLEVDKLRYEDSGSSKDSSSSSSKDEAEVQPDKASGLKSEGKIHHQFSSPEEIKRIERELNNLMRKDRRFEDFKMLNIEDLETLRYEIKKEHPELARVAFNRKNVLDHIWETLLVSAFENLSRKVSDLSTDDRRDDIEPSLSNQSLENWEPKIGVHFVKQLQTFESKCKKKSEKEGIQTEAEKNVAKDEVDPLAVADVGKFYLEKYGGTRNEHFGRQIAVQGDEMTRRRLERVLWHHKIDKIKPVLPLPSLLKKYHTMIKEDLKTRIGPGSYDPEYYNDIQKAKRYKLTKGAMTSKTKRFPEKLSRKRAFTPQAEIGDPYEILDKANYHYRHPCIRTFFEGRRRCFRKLVATGAPVGPGAYEIKSPMQEFLNKNVSSKGPYNVFSGSRDKIMHGYNKTLKTNPKIGPGYYFHEETVSSRMNTRYTHFKGKISKPPPEDYVLEAKTGERNTALYPMWPRASSSLLPGPGAYSDYFKTQTIGYNIRKNKCPFNSETPARPKLKWSDEQEINPTRYRLRKSYNLLYKIHGEGFKSLFKSKVPVRLPMTQIPVITERLRGKDIPREELNRQWEE